MRTLDRKLLRDLWRIKSQAATIALVVACGIGVFVAELSTYDSLQWSRASYYEDARFAHVFADVKRAPHSVTRRIAEIPAVAEVETTVVFEVILDIPGVAEPVTGRMIALPDSGQPRVNRLYLRQGQFPERGRRNEVLVSESFAKARGLQPGDSLAALINGKREQLTIIGVVLSPEYIFSARGGQLPDDKGFGVFWMEREQLASAYNMEGAFNHAAVRLTSGALEPDVVSALDRLLAPYGALGAHGRNEQISHKILSQEINQQKTFASIFPTIFLGVAAFLLHVVLSRQVAMQREQIAALKALGYGNRTIGWHYLKLVLVIVASGILAGVAIGAWLGRYMTEMYTVFFHFPHLVYHVELWIPLTAAVASLGAGVSAALGTMWRVARLAPAEAMRPPAPARFRRMLLERLGLERVLSAQARMVIRILERRPLRTLFTTFAIASSVAVIVAGTFWGDAFDYLISVQFRATQRENVSLGFTDPVNASVRYEIAHLPGVLATEGSRSVPVRLRAGHRSYRTGVLGLPENSELRRLLNADLEQVEPPRSGILLSDRLARRLSVNPGQRVTVEFLEGRRAIRELTVAGVVHDLGGLNGYMEIGALNRIMEEGEVVSAVAVLLDPAALRRFYAEVKQTPKVATVNAKAEALRSLKENTERNVLFFTAIVTVFASAIAVGVVYNSARISLAERAWELASLRVLGFSRGEVSMFLLGELAFELLAAIPIGLFLGWLLSFAIIAMTHSETMIIPLVIAPRTYAYAALATLAAGIVSALIVRHRIDRLDLVAVLKTRE